MTAAAAAGDEFAPARQMRLQRLGAFFPTRLSFMRVLMRSLADARATVRRQVWQLDADGIGHAVYTLKRGAREYSLVVFSHALRDEQRSDRVIAEAWDTTYALYDGAPSAAEVERLRANVPKQEAGRYRQTELALSRANKSQRFFAHTVEQLASGRQPAPELMKSVGYLMRTTAVYGNGKFGIADRALIAGRPELAAPFQAELLTVWLIRLFTFDLVEHIARAKNPAQAAALAPAARRFLGIGNATGLGMAPFLVTHPLLLHRWVETRNAALRQVFAESQARQGAAALARRLRQLLTRALAHARQWEVADIRQQRRIETLRDELTAILAVADEPWLRQPDSCRRLHALAREYSFECQELIIALLLEAEPAVNALAANLGSAADVMPLQPAMTAGELLALARENFAWALAPDYEQPAHSRRFWYISAEKLEPRLGDRYQEAGSDKELPLDIARRIKALASALASAPPEQTAAAFLLAHPECRAAAQRVQMQAAHCYSEIQDNLIGEDCLPIDMLRFKLSFFGACKFDPKSDLWTRISLFQGAPLPDAIAAGKDADDWWLPVYAGECDDVPA